MGKSSKANPLMPLVAGLLAWLVPGAGHVYVRRTLRGVILCICINGLFWAGMAVGGVFTVEPVRQRWWFVAQICTGGSAAAAWYRQQQVHKDVVVKADELAAKTPGGLSADEAYTEVLLADELSLNYPSNTVARAYSGVAGMLNVLAIFDAVLLAAMGRLGEPPPEKKKPSQDRQK